VAILKVWGVTKIKIVSAIASKEGILCNSFLIIHIPIHNLSIRCLVGLKDLYSKHPNVEIIVAAIDDELSEVFLSIHHLH